MTYLKWHLSLALLALKKGTWYLPRYRRESWRHFRIMFWALSRVWCTLLRVIVWRVCWCFDGYQGRCRVVFFRAPRVFQALFPRWMSPDVMWDQYIPF